MYHKVRVAVVRGQEYYFSTNCSKQEIIQILCRGLAVQPADVKVKKHTFIVKEGS